MSKGVLLGARRIVVKVGSSLVTNEGRGVDADAIGNWSRQLAALALQSGQNGGVTQHAAVALIGLGDYQYEIPTTEGYDTVYAPTWGRLRDITFLQPSPSAINSFRMRRSVASRRCGNGSAP